MLSLTILGKRAPGWTREEFQRYWREEHAPLIARVTNFSRHVRSYTQYHTLASPQLEAMFGGARDYDGVAVLTFDDEAAMKAAFSEPDYIEFIRPDELHFVDVDNCMVIVGEINPVIESA